MRRGGGVFDGGGGDGTGEGDVEATMGGREECMSEKGRERVEN